LEEKMQLAVFIDFDNIEIGVKTTLNNELDISLVLDALRERGDVVSKSAYGDWARAGMHSRALTEHAVHMVQRNVTPRGDKNGADINLVVDAMEMCFTRPHINGFAIVGGDSDFIALVEKLKQFGKRIFVVGGRSFTSGILQRNCHEFIAYENLLGGRSRGGDRQPSRGGASPSGRLSIEQGFAQVQRALKILSDRGVEPQLGPLKSTLLQLDSTFSERDYGTSSFREFIQRLSDKHHLSLRRIDNGYVVELNGDGPRDKQPAPRARADGPPSEDGGDAPAGELDSGAEPAAEGGSRADAPARTTELGNRPPEDALALLRAALEKLNESRSGKPLYVRHLAQGLRAVDPEFDEATYGFRTLTELMHLGQREGLLRMQRDRQGAWRVTPVSAASEAPAPGEVGWTPTAVARYAGATHENGAAEDGIEAGPAEAADTAGEREEQASDEPAAASAAESEPAVEAAPANDTGAKKPSRSRRRSTAAPTTARAPRAPRAPRAKTTPRAAKPRATTSRRKTAKDSPSEAGE
jgi:uncharacterized protein (TIGR00288 family)